MPTGKFNYRQLRKIIPDGATQAVIEYPKINNRNMQEAALFSGMNRSAGYDIIDKREGA